MTKFSEISTLSEMEAINGGGLLSCVAGGLAGAMIGTVAGLIPAAATGDAKYIIKSATAGASTGVWVGAGCPLP